MIDAMYIILHTGCLYFDTRKKEAAQEDSSVLHCFSSSAILSIFFFLPHFLLMQLLFFLLVLFQDFLHGHAQSQMQMMIRICKLHLRRI